MIIENIYKGKKATINYIIDCGLESHYGHYLNILHPDIKWKHIEIGDYQGDILSLGYNENKEWFFKGNSYGSCSGCDWLQSITYEAEAIEFFKFQESLEEWGTDINRVKELLQQKINNCWNYTTNNSNDFIQFIENVIGDKNE